MRRILFLFLFLTFQSLAEQLSPCKGDYWTNCFGEYSTNEGTFTGEWLEGKFHGLGKIVHDGDGGITMGEFVYGEPTGCNPYKEALKIYGSSGQWVNPDEILAEAWAQCLDEGL